MSRSFPLISKDKVWGIDASVDRAGRASPQAAARLDHSATIDLPGHTPAPWLCPMHCPPDGFNIDVEGPLGRVVARCDVGKRHGQFRIHGEEAFANARLIAAAPELLAEMKILLASLERGSPRGAVLETTRKRLRAAIAKATGAA